MNTTTNRPALLNFYKMFGYWWRRWFQGSFSSEITSIESLVEFCGRRKIDGFNGECVKAYILWRLFRDSDSTSFVETGTAYGFTAGFVRKVFKTKVFSCEINSVNYLVSRLSLLWMRGVYLHHLDSPVFLEEAFDQGRLGESPLFYLDAHWYDYLPLIDELAVIADHCGRGIVVIDDFRVDSKPGFGYDTYAGQAIGMPMIDDSLKRFKGDVAVYLPAYDPRQEPSGSARGFAVILVGHVEPNKTDAFPYNLLKRVL